MVVDDGSDDAATTAALDALPDRRDSGAPAELRRLGGSQRGLAESATPYVVFLDADDRLAPGALRALRRALERRPARLGFAYGRSALLRRR